MTRRPERGSPWLVVVAVIGIAFALGMVVGSWGISAAPRQPLTVSAPGAGSDIAQPTIQVMVVMEYPTATPTSTPRPTMVPTSTPIPLDVIYPACGPDLPGGTTCRPERPATTPTPYPVCQDGFYPALCVVPGDADAMSARSEVE